MSSILNQWMNLKDVRYHSYVVDIPAGRHVPITDLSQFPGINILLPIERFVMDNMTSITIFMNECWHYSIYLSIIYTITIFSIKYFLSKCEKGYDLKRELIAWNWFLAIFSLIGTIRCLPEFLHVLYHDGFFNSYAQNTYVKVS